MDRNKYAVVKFLSDSSYSEIPSAWLIISDDDDNDNKYQQCWWPPRTTNSALAIANCANPNHDTWNRFEVEFIKYCSSYETARKSAANSNYETTDEERLGRGKRSHVPHNPYKSDEEDDINQDTRKAYYKKKQSKSCILPPVPSYPDTFRSVRKSYDMSPNNKKASYKSAQKSAADANYDTDEEQLSRRKKLHVNYFQSDEEDNNNQQTQNNSQEKRSHVNRFESHEKENNNQQTENNYGKSMYNEEKQKQRQSNSSAGQSCSNTSGSFDMSRNNKDSDKENNLRGVQSSKKSYHRNSPDSPTASTESAAHTKFDDSFIDLDAKHLLILTDADTAYSVAKYESLSKNTDENNRPISPSMLFTPKKRVKSRLAFYPVNLDNTENKPPEQKILLDKFNIKRKEKRKDISEQRNMRCKAERAKLPGRDCWECREYYKMLSLSKEDLQKRKNQCSRHRYKYERPNTPEGFWDPEFPETLSDF